MTTIALIGVLIWLYLLIFQGRFWRVELPAPPPFTAVDATPAHVAIVIPARNEAADIGQTLRALLTQNFDGTLQIFVVDDHSTDGTAATARAAAQDDPRLTILSARDLPQGWTGKLWAVSEGLAAATAADPDFILLTDADITHGSNSIAELVRRSRVEDLDLVSQMVLLRAESWAERALIPAFVFFFFMLYPPRWCADPGAPTAGAAGGCMLVRPAALKRIGGIAAIRGALIDDCTLAGAIKRSGGRIRLDVTETTKSSRVYGSVSEIWSMIARTAFTQLQYSPLLLAGALLGLCVTYLAPALFTLFGHGWARLWGLMAWALMAWAFQPTLRLYKRSPVWGLALPAITGFYAAATLRSAVNYWRGKGGQWKGRAQAISATAGGDISE